MQEHELFLFLVEKALRRLRFMQYIEATESSVFEASINETPREHLLRFDKSFKAFCENTEVSDDEPTRVCALFLKQMESYHHCIQSVRNQDFWSTEKEGVDWTGAYWVCGKNNYVTESLHRMDTMYGSKMSNHDLEWLRMNRFYHF